MKKKMILIVLACITLLAVTDNTFGRSRNGGHRGGGYQISRHHAGRYYNGRHCDDRYYRPYYRYHGIIIILR